MRDSTVSFVKEKDVYLKHVCMYFNKRIIVIIFARGHIAIRTTERSL